MKKIIKNPEFIAIMQGLDFNSRRAGRIEGLLANEIMEAGLGMSDLKKARKQRDVYYSRLIKFISQIELNAIKDIESILNDYIDHSNGIDSPEMIIGKTLDYIKRLFAN